MNNVKNVLNPIQSVSQVVERLASFSPLTAIGTKNFSKVVEAVASGANVVEVLENPVELAGVAPQQAHVFKKFLESHPIPKKLRRIKNIRVIVAQADLDTIEFVDGRYISTRNYSDSFFVGEDKKSGYKEISGSYAAEMLSPFIFDGPRMVTVRKIVDGEVIEREVYAYVLPHVFFIDLKPLKEEDITKAMNIIRLGMSYIDYEGVERMVRYALRSPSQERQVQVVGVAEHIIHPVDVLNILGMNPLAFAKVKGQDKNGEIVYELDYVKAMKRFGLTLSNSVKSNFIRFGKEVVRHENGDISILGGNVSLRIVEDVYSEVSQGKFKAFGKDTKKSRVFDAADHPIEQVAGDGQMYFNNRIKTLAEAEFGRHFQNGVVRLFNGFVKGNAVYIPDLEKYFEEDIVIPMSSFKASTDTLEDVIEDIQLQFRVALFGAPMRFKKRYVSLPYQFIHGMKLSADTMIKLLKPHLDRAKLLLHDVELMKEYLGHDRLLQLEEYSEEEQDELLDSTLVSLLSFYLHYAPNSYQDVFLKEKALSLLQELIKEWKSGLIPVEANYRFIIMDPYAILDAYKLRGTDQEIRKNGKLFVNPNKGIKPGTCFMLEKDGHVVYVGKLAVARNPQMTMGQSRVLEARAYSRYMKKDAFDGMIIMSCHDFNTISQGGADCDGDTSLCMTQPELVTAVEEACKSAPAFLDIHYWEENGQILFDNGCPFKGTVDMSKYKFTFTKSQYTRELQLKMYEISLEYVAETLKPNRIGELTDYATKLADAVRALWYKGRSHYEAGSMSAAKAIIKRVNELQELIDLLAWVQSWEIDRAKHGGAYEEALKEELSFIENPPAEVATYNKKLRRYVWASPSWFAHLKGKSNGIQNDSVLSRVHEYMLKWEEQEFIADIKKLRSEYAENNLLSAISTVVEVPQSHVEQMAVLSNVRMIKSMYNTAISNAYRKFDTEMSQLEFISFASDYAKEQYINQLKRDLDDSLNFITEKCQAEFMALSEQFDPAYIGLVAYQMTYSVSASKRGATVDEPARGLSFPWVVAKHQFVAALRKVSGTEHLKLKEPQVTRFDQLEVTKVNIGNFTPGYTPEMVANMIQNWANHIAVMVQADELGNLRHEVYVKKQRVASIYPEYVTFFTGATRFVAKVKDFQVNKKSLTFYLESVTRYS